MMKNIRKHIALLALMIMLPAMTYAQDGLTIKSLFDTYGKRKGSVMAALSGEAVSSYKLDKYVSLTLTYDRNIFAHIQRCLETDKQQARKIKEVITDGVISSGFYQLPERNNRNRYILFKTESDKKATIIYMEGGRDSEELINRLFIKNRY